MPYWDTQKIEHACTVDGCDVPATVTVLDDMGDDRGYYCGPHADELVNTENAPLFEALRQREAERIAAEM